MILQNNGTFKQTLSGIYEYVKNNIKYIMSDPKINDMLDPKNNITTKKCLEENDDDDAAFSESYFLTLIVLMSLYDINIDDA
ncbi:hypothetical protein Indivirus_2_40 [Indivirus ILV1]|uniref:Uncharacterized protein n=1 Tax=Indivirus ILV1 TaxID=1977633 RepID=A0A1V0SD93_9VIRU|nr:hypothetical protein Indivirus_2_40 [Indivirus ILV1]